MHKLVLSLFDHSGEWSRPYLESGHIVVRVDIKHRNERAEDGGWNIGMSVGHLRKLIMREGNAFFENWVREELSSCVVLMAPPCTDFALSGAQHWERKDAAGVTTDSIRIVREALDIVRLTGADWWALENPVGRLQKLVPEVGDPVLLFNPCDYAMFADDWESDAYNKKTQLWGSFNPELPLARAPPRIVKRGAKSGSPVWASTGGSSARTKEIRSKTPQGFSRAFHRANP